MRTFKEWATENTSVFSEMASFAGESWSHPRLGIEMKPKKSIESIVKDCGEDGCSIGELADKILDGAQVRKPGGEWKGLDAVEGLKGALKEDLKKQIRAQRKTWPITAGDKIVYDPDSKGKRGAVKKDDGGKKELDLSALD